MKQFALFIIALFCAVMSSYAQDMAVALDKETRCFNFVNQESHSQGGESLYYPGVSSGDIFEMFSRNINYSDRAFLIDGDKYVSNRSLQFDSNIAEQIVEYARFYIYKKDASHTYDAAIKYKFIIKDELVKIVEPELLFFRLPLTAPYFFDLYASNTWGVNYFFKKDIKGFAKDSYVTPVVEVFNNTASLEIQKMVNDITTNLAENTPSYLYYKAAVNYKGNEMSFLQFSYSMKADEVENRIEKLCSDGTLKRKGDSGFYDYNIYLDGVGEYPATLTFELLDGQLYKIKVVTNRPFSQKAHEVFAGIYKNKGYSVYTPSKDFRFHLEPDLILTKAAAAIEVETSAIVTEISYFCAKTWVTSMDNKDFVKKLKELEEKNKAEELMHRVHRESELHKGDF